MINTNEIPSITLDTNGSTDSTNGSLEENYKNLQSIVDSINIDFDKFKTKKIKACGIRVRNNLLNIKKICDKLRVQLLKDIKDIGVKPRSQSVPKDGTTSKSLLLESKDKPSDTAELLGTTLEMLGVNGVLVDISKVKPKLTKQKNKIPKVRKDSELNNN